MRKVAVWLVVGIIAFLSGCGGSSDPVALSNATTPAATLQPTVTLTASPTSITSGQSSTLSVSSTNASSCSGSGFTASGTSGSVSVAPTVSTTYSITCTGSGGSASASATVSVGPGGPNPIPLVLTALSLGNAVQGQAYTSAAITASGGTGTIHWTATGLPPGLQLSAATGASIQITGTPTTATGSPFNVSITATDSGTPGGTQQTVAKQFSLVVSATVSPGGAADGIPAGFPNSTNTGYKKAPGYPGSLTDCSGITIQSNHTYSFCDFPGTVDVGSPSAPLVNVTFYGSRFHTAGDVLVRLYGDNIGFDYDSFEPSVSAPPVSYSQGYQYGIEADGGWHTFVQRLTVTHSDMWGFGNGIDVAGSTQAKPHVFRDNWIHDARDDGGIDHTDGLGQQSGGNDNSYVVVDHNTIASFGNTQAIAYQGSIGYDHFTVTNNYLSGFGYTVAIGPGNGNTNTTFTGNTFGTTFRPNYGPLYGWSDSGNNVWKCNKIHFAPGTTWTSGNGWHPVASDDGKFWTPGGFNFVSATDWNGNTSCP